MDKFIKTLACIIGGMLMMSGSGLIEPYEKGERDPAGSNLFSLADALGVSARWLVLGVDDGSALPLPIPSSLHPVITQSKACLIAYIESGMKSHDLVSAAISILSTSSEIGPTC